MMTDTIAAIITAPGKSAVGIVRMSGPDVYDIAERLDEKHRRFEEVPSHTAHYGWVVDANQTARIDEVLFLVMKAPRSYTGEDVIEVHCHGGSAALGAILHAVFALGARPADAGEFSRRAFLNGKLDLTRAEAVMDIIDAPAEQALHIATEQKRGWLADEVIALRDELIELIAFLQADLDYPEDDIERLTRDEYIARAEALLNTLDGRLRSAERGRRLREGLHIAIAGRPNVGKSSLLNALIGRERAIVTDVPGTTRDVVSESIDVRGIPIRISDTAGIRQTDDVVEKIGVDLAKQSLEDADLALFVYDAAVGRTAEDEAIYAQVADRTHLIIANKIDLCSDMTTLPAGAIAVSARARTGLDALSDALYDHLVAGTDDSVDRHYVTNLRHVALLEQARDDLRAFIEGVQAGITEDMLVIDLQHAWEILGLVTGETASDDLIDTIFSRFCLGK